MLNTHSSHCERSEAIQSLSAGTVWIASSLSLLAMSANQRPDYKE